MHKMDSSLYMTEIKERKIHQWANINSLDSHIYTLPLHYWLFQEWTIPPSPSHIPLTSASWSIRINSQCLTIKIESIRIFIWFRYYFVFRWVDYVVHLQTSCNLTIICNKHYWSRRDLMGFVLSKRTKGRELSNSVLNKRHFSASKYKSSLNLILFQQCNLTIFMWRHRC